MAGELNLMGGLLRGFAQGKQRQLELEERKAKTAAEKPYLELQKMVFQQIADEMKRRQEAQRIKEQQAAAQGEPKNYVEKRPEYGASFEKQEGGGLTEIIAGMDPMLLSLAGGPLASAAKFGQGERRIDVSKESLAERVSRGDEQREEAILRYQEMVRRNDIAERKALVDVQQPGGGTIKMPLPQAGQGIQTKLSVKDMPIAEGNLPLWRHPDTLAPAQVGMTPNQAKAQGYKRVTTGQLESIMSFAQVEEILGSIETLMKKVFPEQEGPVGRIIGGPKRKLSALAQTNPDAATLERLINGTLAPTDSGDVAWNMLKELKSMIAKNKQAKLGGVFKQKKKAPIKLTEEKAIEFLKQAGGDKDKARKMATAEGFTF
jgi:hypothetical protein